MVHVPLKHSNPQNNVSVVTLPVQNATDLSQIIVLNVNQIFIFINKLVMKSAPLKPIKTQPTVLIVTLHVQNAMDLSQIIVLNVNQTLIYTTLSMFWSLPL
jgi:hypothetical protein